MYVVPAQNVSLQEAEDALDAALTAFIDEGVDQEHLDRIKTQIDASTIFEQDNQESVARSYGEGLTTGLTIQDIQDWPNVLAAVTAQDIMDAARNVLDPKASVTGWIRAPQEAAK